MTGSPAPQTPADRIAVEFPASEGYRSVGRLVLGGLASRFALPVDRLEDLQLAVESLLLEPSADGTVTLVADASEDELRVRVGPFSAARVADAAVGRVLSRLVDHAADVRDTDGSWVELAVTTARLRNG